MRIAPLAAAVLLACLSFGAGQPTKPPKSGPPPQTASSSRGDPYSMTVPVDASAASTSVAQNNAINGGRAKAWLELSHRLVPQKDWSKIPNLDSGALERLVRGYSVSNEKRSTTRYVARITYVFNPNAVKHLLRVANIGIAEPSGSAILLVAMAPTYSAHSPWARAIVPKATADKPALVTPVGDAVDQSSLGGLRFSGASWAQIQPAAARVHAGSAILLQVGNPAASKVTIRMRQVGPGRQISLHDIELPVAAGTPTEKVYASAADQAQAAIQDALISKTTVDLSRKERVVAEARILSLEQWVALQRRLSSISALSDLDVLAMNTGEARVAFAYGGTRDQLRAALAQSNISVIDRGGSWWLGAGRPQPAATDSAE